MVEAVPRAFPGLTSGATPMRTLAPTASFPCLQLPLPWEPASAARPRRVGALFHPAHWVLVPFLSQFLESSLLAGSGFLPPGAILGFRGYQPVKPGGRVGSSLWLKPRILGAGSLMWAPGLGSGEGPLKGQSTRSMGLPQQSTPALLSCLPAHGTQNTVEGPASPHPTWVQALPCPETTDKRHRHSTE